MTYTSSSGRGSTGRRPSGQGSFGASSSRSGDGSRSRQGGTSSRYQSSDSSSRGDSSSSRPTRSGGSSRFSGGARSGGGSPRSGGGSRFGGGSSRSGGGGSRFGSGSSGGGRRRKQAPERIDVSLFVNKAEKVTHEIYTPKHKFSDFPIDERVLVNIEAKGFENPSPIQDQAIAYALKGTDVIGLANTGTGKTAAFLIPLLHRLLQDPKKQALVIAPTRELAMQIEKECFEFAKNLNLPSVVCVGGAGMYPQLQKLQRNPRIIIGTPGRLLDFVKRGKIKLANIGTIVLDEADRMLDMGFINDITYILSEMPKERHCMLFSATFPPQIETLAYDFLQNPVKIAVASRNTSKNVDQDIIRVPNKSEKFPMLISLLQKKGFDKVLIFVETKRFADEIESRLKSENFSAAAMHGDKRHNERVRTLESFERGRIKILIATDVAARGLDVKDITHVINYDTPSTYDTYVHRIGRTGRGDKKGVALTFV
jgi:superfamily II DNA/RNA helicase